VVGRILHSATQGSRPHAVRMNVRTDQKPRGCLC
jgi:hypothetical protein